MCLAMTMTMTLRTDIVVERLQLNDYGSGVVVFDDENECCCETTKNHQRLVDCLVGSLCGEE